MRGNFADRKSPGFTAVRHCSHTVSTRHLSPVHPYDVVHEQTYEKDGRHLHRT